MVLPTAQIPQNNNIINDESGFTLVEILIVLALIAILSAAVLSGVNYTQQRRRAEDEIRKANVMKLVQNIYNYYYAFKLYPRDADANGDPVDDPYVADYIKGGWLFDEPRGTTYFYAVNANRRNFGIMVELSTGRRAKFRSEWDAIRDCSPTASASGTGC